MKIRQPSLKRQLLIQLLPVMLIIIIAGSGVAYFVAKREATIAYDRALMDESIALASQVEVLDGSLHLQLSSLAEKILLADAYDKLYYEIIDMEGATIAGNANLPRPVRSFEDNKLYYDGRLNGKRVRVAALTSMHDSTPFIVLFAETKQKRDRLLGEILLAMLIPEALLMVVATFMIQRSTRKTLTSIQPLLDELVQKTHSDLTQLSLQDIPEEIYPIFVEINGLLARLSKSLDSNQRFIADASHQLRTPIAALQAEAELALRSSNPTESLYRIVSGTKRLTHLAHQLLTLSRLDPKLMQLPTIANLIELTTNTAERLMPLALERRIDLGFELNPARVMGSSLWLEELFSNLIDNAIRYTPTGGVVTVRCRSMDDKTIWEIEDSGPGIPKEDRENVFERFYRLGTTEVDGCGLGLSIVREIAYSHNASVEIEKGPCLGGALIRVTFEKAFCEVRESVASSATTSVTDEISVTKLCLPETQQVSARG